MAHSNSARKRARQSETKRVANKAVKTALKTELKKVRAYEKDNVLTAEKEVIKLQKMLDKAAKKNIIHKNKASRLKSRLALFVNKLKSIK